MRATLLAVLIVLAAPANASPITYYFSGTVTGFNGDQAMIDIFMPGLELGAGFVGSVSYDTESITSDVSMSLAVAGNTLANDTQAYRFVSNDNPGDRVSFTQPGMWAIPDASYPVGGSFRGEVMRAQFDDVTGTALSGNQLPLDLASVFPSGSFSFLGQGVCDTQLCADPHSFFISWGGQIDTFAVPEPETVPLLVSGLLAALFTRRRRVRRA